MQASMAENIYRRNMSRYGFGNGPINHNPNGKVLTMLQLITDPKIAKLNLGYKRRASKKGRSLGDDVKLENVLREFGLTLFAGIPREEVFAQVPIAMRSRKPEYLTKAALEFLVDEFDAKVVTDQHGRNALSFPEEKPKGDEMNLISEVAERAGQKRSVVKDVYEALLKTVRITLRNERRIRLPDFAVVKVSYRKPRERQKKWNPFKKKKTWVEARPASNKIRISAIKKFKTWAAEKIEVVEPKKKHKKK